MEPEENIASAPDFFGPGALFHHVGIVVSKIDAAGLGLRKFVDPRQDVTVAFANLNGATIELIEPLSNHSPVSQNLKKGIKLAHLCYTIPDIDQAVAHAARHGFRLIARPTPAVAFNQRRIAWLYHGIFGLFELLEAAVAKDETTGAR